ncbi:hypothetical protein [Lactiplantibacillus mudanjiangensis]|uniref:Uncharacterized protein n=1 Tax=Lactiplantibacillus mudanjiangensis TaxID=1296538 RepID=A0A660DZD9_9LACO|nr:hypothetical protein [Lactiplantibacillus mudanjiangensis]VDG22573.1 hypothetical protein [Lactobacillus sp. CBA3605] [Lactiplantibacillus mudanjiangensis]VDG26891.1 hypothetical protein [Lactobacillus sp. CBA3605] [Lactiplantibacillus mudanjiangensis]
MAKDKVKIDPDKFARAVVSGANLTGEDDVRLSKNALKLYLQAYFLIEKFNGLESEQFKFTKSTNFEYMIKALDHIKLS